MFLHLCLLWFPLVSGFPCWKLRITTRHFSRDSHIAEDQHSELRAAQDKIFAVVGGCGTRDSEEAEEIVARALTGTDGFAEVWVLTAM